MASHKAKAASRFLLLLLTHIHLSKHVVIAHLRLLLLLLHEVSLTSHWHAHSHARLLLSLWLLVEHHTLGLELRHLLLLRLLLHETKASRATSLSLSLTLRHTTTHHRRPLLLLHAEPSVVSAHSSHSSTSTNRTLLLAPNAVQGVRILSEEQVRSRVILLLIFVRIFRFQYLGLIFLHGIEIKERT